MERSQIQILVDFGYWAYGIQRLRKGHIPVSPFSEELWKEVTESVLATSLVNIKKSGGRSSSNKDDLEQYVAQDSRLIGEQVKCLSPHVIVCCGTWTLVRNSCGQMPNKCRNEFTESTICSCWTIGTRQIVIQT